LPYTAEVYFAQIGQYVQATWPARWLLPGLLLIGIALAFGKVRWRARLVSAILASVWVWIGAIFHNLYFAELNFAAPVYAGLFVMEGVLLFESGVIHDQLDFDVRNSARIRPGLLLLLTGFLAYPLVDWLSGLNWQQLRWPGLAPTPTAIVTLGALSLAKRAPARLYLIPVAWLVLAAGSGWMLNVNRDPVLAAVTIVVLVTVSLAKRRRN